LAPRTATLHSLKTGHAKGDIFRTKPPLKPGGEGGYQCRRAVCAGFFRAAEGQNQLLDQFQEGNLISFVC